MTRKIHRSSNLGCQGDKNREVIVCPNLRVNKLNFSSPTPPPWLAVKLLIKLKVWEKLCLVSNRTSGREVMVKVARQKATCFRVGSFFEIKIATGMARRAGVRAIWICQIRPASKPKRGKTE